MKFWNLLAFVEDEQLIDAARFCEDVGFDGVGVSDHLFVPETFQTRYPGSKAGSDGTPFFTIDKKWSFPDPFVTLGMIAMATKRVKLFQSIFIGPARNPMEVAKASGTLATFAPDRLRVCPAVGWMKDEFDVYGVDFHTRGRRLDEMIEVLRKLWSGEIVEHHGEFFDFPRLRSLPAPGHIPILPAGAAPAVMRRAAYLGDGWMDFANAQRNLAVIDELQQMRRDAGRDHLPFEIVMSLTDPLNVDSIRRAEDKGVTAAILLPAYFTLNKRSTLDEKKRLWDDFAEKVIRNFP